MSKRPRAVEEFERHGDSGMKVRVSNTICISFIWMKSVEVDYRKYGVKESNHFVKMTKKANIYLPCSVRCSLNLMGCLCGLLFYRWQWLSMESVWGDEERKRQTKSIYLFQPYTDPRTQVSKVCLFLCKIQSLFWESWTSGARRFCSVNKLCSYRIMPWVRACVKTFTYSCLLASDGFWC